MAFPVKWFSSSWRGAPVINGQAGSLIGALEACLITGFGEITATSVTVTGGIATATHNSGDWFADYAVISVSGATPAELNGESRVLSHTATTTTWTTTAVDGAATGVIKIRYAPVGGWEKTYSGTNKAVFRSIDLQANGHYLRVDDTDTTVARVRGFETMPDVDTGTGPFPTDTQINGGGYWNKSSAASVNANEWTVAADVRFFILSIAISSGTTAAYRSAPAMGFGDLVSLAASGDGWNTALNCAGASGSTNTTDPLEGGADQSAAGGATYLARDVSGLGGSRYAGCRGYVGVGGLVSGNDTVLGAAPSIVDGQIKTSRVYVRLAGSPKDDTPRSDVPGVLHISQTNAAALLTPYALSNGVGDLAGRTLMAMPTAPTRNSAPAGMYFVDITGPWR